MLSGLFLIFGTHTIIPLLLNILISTGLIVLVYRLLEEQGVSRSSQLGMVLLMLFVTPMPAMIFSGQEHVLQAFIVIGFVFLSARDLVTQREVRLSSNARYLLLLCPFVTMVRYEGMFLILIVCLLYMLQRRFLFAFIVGVLGFLPILIMGLIAMRQGWFFFPNSVYIKGNLAGIHTVGDFKTLTINSLFWMQSKLVRSPALLFLMLLAAFTYIYKVGRSKKFWMPQQIMLLMFLGVAFFHAVFAHTAWFYRYEAYLVALGVLVVLPVLLEFLQSYLRPRITGTSISLHTLYVFALTFCVPCVALISILLYTQPDCRSWKGWFFWYETKLISSLGLSCGIMTFLDFVKIRKPSIVPRDFVISNYYMLVLILVCVFLLCPPIIIDR